MENNVVKDKLGPEVLIIIAIALAVGYLLHKLIG
jgi:hypothetical protein